jgi:hypothetical protein
MMILGCDFHPRFQQIAYVDQESGKCREGRLKPTSCFPIWNILVDTKPTLTYMGKHEKT